MKKNIVRTAIVAGVIAAAGLGMSSSASASTYGYEGDQDPAALALELWDAGASGTTGVDALSLADSVCKKRNSGVSESALIKAVSSKVGSSIAYVSVVGAEYHFCPAGSRLLAYPLTVAAVPVPSEASLVGVLH